MYYGINLENINPGVHRDSNIRNFVLFSKILENINLSWLFQEGGRVCYLEFTFKADKNVLLL